VVAVEPIQEQGVPQRMAVVTEVEAMRLLMVFLLIAVILIKAVEGVAVRGQILALIIVGEPLEDQE
jgi:hypothetical protein